MQRASWDEVVTFPNLSTRHESCHDDLYVPRYSMNVPLLPPIHISANQLFLLLKIPVITQQEERYRSFILEELRTMALCNWCDKQQLPRR